MTPSLAAAPLANIAHQASQAGSITAPAASNAVHNNTSPQLDPNQLKDLINNQLGTNNHNPLPPDIESFYTMGPDAVPPTAPPVSTAPTMSIDSANLFNDLPRYLSQVGGPNEPTALLAAQVQVTQASLAWQLMGQVASKAVSGIQSLFNNQV